MKTIIPEKQFPRGGTKPKKWNTKSEFDLFKAKKSKKTVKRKKSKQTDNTNQISTPLKVGLIDNDKINYINELSNRDISPGQILLSRICEVTDGQISVNLPGGLRGFVSLGEISDIYTQRIQAAPDQVLGLRDLFEPGTVFPVIVQSQFLNSVYAFNVSLNPKLINFHLTKAQLMPGMILTGVVKSHEDHGFIIDLGITKVHCFLKQPRDNFEEGQLLRLVVISVSDNLVRVSTLEKDLDVAFVKGQLSLDCYLPGFQFKLIVKRNLKNILQVQVLNTNVMGYIHHNYLNKLFDKIENYPENCELLGTLMYILPLVKIPVFKVSYQREPSWNFRDGDLTKGIVKSVTARGLYLKIGDKPNIDKCFVPLNHMNEYEKVLSKEINLNKVYKVGQTIDLVRIARKDYLNRSYFGYTDRESVTSKFFSIRDVKIGQVIKSKLLVIKDKYCTLSLGQGRSVLKGVVSGLHMLDNPEANYMTKFKKGQLVKARVLNVDKKEKKIILTLKQTLVLSKEPILKSYKKATVGQPYLGTIIKVSDQFLIVSFYRNVTGAVFKNVTPFADEDSLVNKYSVGQVVNCYVINSQVKRLKLSLLTPSEMKLPLRKKNNTVGFMTSSDRQQDPMKKRRESTKSKDGNPVSGKISSNHEPDPHTKEAEVCEIEESAMSDTTPSVPELDTHSTQEELMKSKNGQICDTLSITTSSDSESEFELLFASQPELELELKQEESTESVVDQTSDPVSVLNSSDSESEPEPDLKLDEIPFKWDVMTNPNLLTIGLDQKPESSSSESETEDDSKNAKKRKRLSVSERKEKAKREEERLRSIEEELMDSTRRPKTADDFDRLVCAVPDDCSIWLQYMAFHLENTEIEKARAVGQRALKAIPFREDVDKLNIWLALLNLEHLYGTTETQQKTLEEALKCNDPYKIHLHQLGFGGEDCEKLAFFMLKKYPDEQDLHCSVGQTLMKLGKVDAARNVLQRALASLPNAKHVGVITRFAQLENKHGSTERAHTLYEHVLTSFPKRVDVWCAYVDLLIKSQRIDLARKVLERATSQTLPIKKMKVLFKKLITFEETFGNEEDVKRVRNAAMEYLDSLNSVN